MNRMNNFLDGSLGDGLQQGSTSGLQPPQSQQNALMDGSGEISQSPFDRIWSAWTNQSDDGGLDGCSSMNLAEAEFGQQSLAAAAAAKRRRDAGRDRHAAGHG